MERHYDWEKVQKNKFTKIYPNKFFGFQPKADNKTVYCSIFSEDGVVAINTAAKQSDYSVIIDAEGSPHTAQYGKVRIDDHGFNHEK